MMWTKNQKRAIKQDGNVLVSASAGSGKTAVLVERIMYYIKKGISLKDMLVLVYNNQAAEELRQRIGRELLSFQDENVLNEIDNLPFAKISTLHAFCLSKVRENFDFFELEPSFEIASEEELNAIYNKAITKTVKYYFEKDDTLFSDMISMFGAKRDEEGITQTILKLYNIKEIMEDGEHFLQNLKGDFLSFENSNYAKIILDEVTIKAKEFCEKLLHVKNMLINASSGKVLDNIVSALYFANGIAESKSICELVKALNVVNKERWSSPKQLDKEIVDYAKNIRNEFFDFAQNWKCKIFDVKMLEQSHHQNGEILDKLIEATKVFECFVIKLKQNKLTFNDLEHLTLKLLKSDRGEEIKQSIKLVYVDEYQDINKIQESLIRELAPNDSCFMVGDIKQSIYGFRLADPTIFIDKLMRYDGSDEDTIDGEGKLISLNSNFRSRDEILDFVNKLFCKIMTKENSGIDYESSSLFEIEGKNLGGSVEIHTFSSKKGEEKSFNGVYDIKTHPLNDSEISSAVEEGEFIASKIKEHMLSGEAQDYGDFAVLFSKRSKRAQIICETLLNNGIPLGSSNFIESRENAEWELILLLQAIDNPYNAIPFAGFLLTYFGGYDEDELISLGKGNLYENLIEVAKNETPLGLKAAKTISDLNSYRLEASMGNVSTFLHKIILTSGYHNYLKADTLTEIEKFLSELEDKDLNCSITKFLGQYNEDSTDKSVSLKREGKVAVMTIHASKGLEFPIVFLASLGEKFKKETLSENLVIDQSGLIGIKGFDVDLRRKNMSISLIATTLAINKRQMAERIRLLYVAMTRAKTRLYLCGENNNDSYMELVVSNSKLPINDNYEHKEKKEENTILQIEPSIDIVNAILKARSFEYKWSKATLTPQKQSVSSIAEDTDYAITPFREESVHKGNAYHFVMEHIDFNCENVALAIDEIESKNATYNFKDLICVEEIEACLKSDLIVLAKSKLTEREKPFTMLIGDEDKVLVQGVIDLLIFDEDGVIIVDYKNSNRSDEDLIKTYYQQLSLYKQAVEGTGNFNVKGCYIYSFPKRKAIKVL